MFDLSFWKLVVIVFVNIFKYLVKLLKFWEFLFLIDLFLVFLLIWFWGEVYVFVLVVIVDCDDFWLIVFFVICNVFGEFICLKKFLCEIVVNGNCIGSEIDLGLVFFFFEFFLCFDFFNMVDVIVMYVFCEFVVLIGKYIKENLFMIDYYELNDLFVNFLFMIKKGVKFWWNFLFIMELELF